MRLQGRSRGGCSSANEISISEPTKAECRACSRPLLHRYTIVRDGLGGRVVSSGQSGDSRQRPVDRLGKIVWLSIDPERALHLLQSHIEHNSPIRGLPGRGIGFIISNTGPTRTPSDHLDSSTKGPGMDAWPLLARDLCEVVSRPIPLDEIPAGYGHRRCLSEREK